ncbi:MAG: hypothetical protein IPK60_11190 [Sandaracinaceae bacterium]|jgi:hypothetical protein|nr:hypothetical protein [Sandaracinaceae bacterium]
MRLTFFMAVVVAVSLTGCLDDTLPPGEGENTEIQFIPNASDFQDFQGWPVAVHRTDRSGRPISLYMSRSVPAEGYEFAKGTLIVKTVEIGSGIDDWEVHAMVKRGGAYGAMGAPGWEFLNLHALSTGAVVILDRGDGTGLGHYSDPTEIPGAMTDAVCLDCHGDAGDNDYVMAPEFRIGTVP